VEGQGIEDEGAPGHHHGLAGHHGLASGYAFRAVAFLDAPPRP
jgi:hypothetical protein